MGLCGLENECIDIQYGAKPLLLLSKYLFHCAVQTTANLVERQLSALCQYYVNFLSFQSRQYLKNVNREDLGKRDEKTRSK